MSAQAPQILSDRHAMLRINAQSHYLLLPIQEREEIANISILVNGKQVKSLNAKLAVDKVDYYVRRFQITFQQRKENDEYNGWHEVAGQADFDAF